METQAVEPTARILQRFLNCSPTEVFGVGGVTVGGQAFMYETTFRIAQELRGIRVIMNKPIRGKGNKNGKNTFLSSRKLI